MSAEPQGVARRALVIGIDAYDSSIGALKGCVNDATLMRDVLRDQVLVPEENIRFLTNEAATRNGILDGFEWLIAESNEHDMAIIYYAGHGSRVRDDDGDEADGTDSTLVPVDAIRWSQIDESVDNPELLDITDDEIQLKLLRLSERTDNITMIFDCCHSGTISRGPSEELARSAPDELRPPELFRRPPLSEEDRRVRETLRSTGSRQRSSSGWWAPEDRYVLIAGCRDAEQSYEMPDPKHGRLTFHLASALIRAKPGTTFRQVFEEISEKVVAEGQARSQSQHPQLEGAADRLLFQTTEIEPLRYVRVRAQDGAVLTLGGGAAHGLTVGSRWAVIPAGGTREDAKDPLAHIDITDVGVVESSGRLVEEGFTPQDGSLIGTWAVEVAKDFGDLRMKVRLVGEKAVAPAAWADLSQGLADLEGILQREESGSCVRVVLVPAGERAEEAPQLVPNAKVRIAVVSEGGELMMPPKPADAQGVRSVLTNLQLWAEYRFKLAIDNPDSLLTRDCEVLVFRKRAGEWAPVREEDGEALPVLYVGDQIDIRLRNRGSERIWVSGFSFEMTGAVTVLKSGFWLGPNEEPFSITGGQGTNPLTWQDEFPFNPNPYTRARTEGLEVHKYFLSSTEIDLSGMVQRGGNRGAGGHPLGLLVSTASTRGTSIPTLEDWGTLTFAFLLRQAEAADLREDRAQRVGGARVRSEGGSSRITAGGTVEIAGIQRRPEWKPDTPAARLRAAMADAGFREVAAHTVDSGRGSGRGAEAVVIETDPLDPDWGELLMSQDDAGLVRWHLPVPDPSGARGGGRGASYRIAAPVALDPETSGARGALGSIAGKWIVDRFAFPWAESAVGRGLEALERRIRPHRARWFGPEDLRSGDVRPLDGEGWRRLAEGPALLLLHGTFSRADRAFLKLPPEVLERLGDRYGARVFALDHPTVTQDPAENVRWLLEQLPEDIRLNVDVVAHSRGGLVARALAAAPSNGDPRIRVGRIVTVGSPNAGTALADPAHMSTLLDVFTNLFALWDPSEVAGVLLQYVTRLATGAFEDLRGLKAMMPGSEFLGELGGRGVGPGTRVYGIASDLSTREDKGMLDALRQRVLRELLPAANDLVVPKESVVGSEAGVAFAETRTLTGTESTSHVGYFESPEVLGTLQSWLLRDEDPARVLAEPAVEAQPPAILRDSEPAPVASEATDPVLPEPEATHAVLPEPVARDLIELEPEETEPGTGDAEPVVVVGTPDSSVCGDLRPPDPPARRWGQSARDPLRPPLPPGRHGAG